jgi:hypothetical protein
MEADMKEKFRKLHNQFMLNANDNKLLNVSDDSNIRRLHQGLIDLCVTCEELARKLEESTTNQKKTGEWNSGSQKVDEKTRANL